MPWNKKSIFAAFILLAIVASPFSVFGGMTVSPIFPMHAWPERCEAVVSCIENCWMLAQVNPASRKGICSGSSAENSSPNQCKSTLQKGTQGIAKQCIIGLNGRVSGIRRIYPKNVLDHPQRKAVYDFIMANPGIDLGRIGKALDLNRETLRYHIDLLASSNKIVVMREHGIIRYYENHGRYGPLERRVLAHLWNPTARQIISIVHSNPGITQRDIAIRLSIASPTVHWYIQRFATDGILTSEHAGRFTRYRITMEALQVLTKPAESQKSIQSVLYT